MTIDLQEQLRDIADTLVGCEWNHPLCSEETCRSAAAQIEQMTLENERLRGELHKTSQGLYATGRAEIEKLRQQLAAQMVEIERLQEALRELEIDNHDWQKRPCPTCRNISKVLGRDFGCVSKCRKAAAEAGGEEES